MKKIIIFSIILTALTACANFHDSAGLPNPASAYCEQNGNKLKIVTATDGSQSGICVFPDESTCDEWAYYRGECDPDINDDVANTSGSAEETNAGGYMTPGATEQITDWRGVIKNTEPGSQYDDYFERRGLGQITYFGIDSMDPSVKSRIEILRDSGKIVHLYGILVSNVPDYNNSQILVDRIEVEE